MAAKRSRIKVDDFDEKKRKFEKIAENLEEKEASEFLKDNFLPYAWSFSLDRALTDVTGLKPVQRRILYTMYENRLSPSASRSKVATLAGSVLKYHPHGDASVMEALKNLARDHIFRVPLIDGKGDFGAPGSPGAAGRYIEARLNKAAWLNVEDISEEATRMVPNYDGTSMEPVKIPVKWPVDLINGGSGIAVGYATNIPSHNPTEVMNAVKAMLEDPELDDEKLCKIISGPDFNMGGQITTIDGVKDYIKTGSGSFKIRAKYEVMQKARGSWRIEFYEIPFGSYPEKIISQIQKAMDKGNFAEVANYKDLSDLKNPIRIIIETKSNVNYKKVLKDLFKMTDLESSFSVNMTTIIDNQPIQSPMRDLILDFINFRKTCVKNKSRYNLDRKTNRKHLVDGLLKVLLDIDKAIAIIRGSDDSSIANTELQRVFNIDEKQADHVLSLQLRRLTKMDSIELENEKVDLEKEIEYLESLISDDNVLKKYLLNEFDETIKVIGDDRKTEISGLTAEEFAEQEKEMNRSLKAEDKNVICYITRFSNGALLKGEEPFVYQMGVKNFENGPIMEQIKVKSKENISLVFSDGMAHSIPLSYLSFNIPITAEKIGINRGRGVKLVAIAKNTVLKTDIGLMLATEQGDVKIVKPELPEREEFSVYNLNDGDKIISGMWLGRTIKDSYFVSITNDSQVLAYDATSVRPTGISAGGVKSQKLRSSKEKVIAFNWVPKLGGTDNFIVSQSQHSIKLTLLSQIPPKGRGSQGVALHKFKKTESSLKSAYTGSNLGLTYGTNNRFFPLPKLSERARTGEDFEMITDFGLKEAIIM